MIEVLREILAEHFEVSVSQVIPIATESHSDGLIFGFDIMAQTHPTFVYAQVASSDWENAEFQIHIPQFEAWARLWTFPNDPYLEGLAMLGIKPALNQLLQKLDRRFQLQEVKNVSYRPGKRAVFRLSTNLGVFYAKSTTSKNAQRIIGIQSAIESKVNTAQLIGLANDDLLFFTEVKGSNFLEIPDPEFDLVTVEIQSLQDSFATIQTEFEAKRKVITNLEWYLNLLESNDRVETDFYKRVQEHAATLETVKNPQTTTFIHGDFHLGQLKFQTSNRLGILDFDNAGMGQIADDYATILASSFFGLLTNRGNSAHKQYSKFLDSWLHAALKPDDFAVVKGLASRHMIAYLGSFPGQIGGREDSFLELLAALGADHESFLISASSLIHEPM